MPTRTLFLAAAALCLAIGSAIAAPPSTQSNCRSSFDNGQVRIACGDNIDPAFFQTGASRRDREEVNYTRAAAPSAAPAQSGANFCGPGYRYSAASGCEPVKPLR